MGREYGESKTFLDSSVEYHHMAESLMGNAEPATT